jgi:hypothetical protein
MGIFLFYLDTGDRESGVAFDQAHPWAQAETAIFTANSRIYAALGVGNAKRQVEPAPLCFGNTQDVPLCEAGVTFFVRGSRASRTCGSVSSGGAPGMGRPARFSAWFRDAGNESRIPHR